MGRARVCGDLSRLRNRLTPNPGAVPHPLELDHPDGVPCCGSPDQGFKALVTKHQLEGGHSGHHLGHRAVCRICLHDPCSGPRAEIGDIMGINVKTPPPAAEAPRGVQPQNETACQYFSCRRQTSGRICGPYMESAPKGAVGQNNGICE